MIKNELKNKILNDLNNYKYYEIKYDDEITNNDKITINKVQYNIHTFICKDCENETRFITALNWDDLYNELLNNDFYKLDANNDLICYDCVADHYYMCDNCGELINTRDDYNYVTLDDGRNYCETCANDYTFYCEHCETYYDNRNHNYYETAYNTTICDDCYYDNYATCEHCGDIYDRDEMIYGDDCDAYYCDNCYDEMYFNYDDVITDDDTIRGDINAKQLKSAVRDYHDTPRDFIKRHASDENDDVKLFYGVELETSANDYETQKSASVYIANNLNAIIENDSSVCGYPMEIISDPQTIKKWDARREKITTIFNELQRVGVTSHNNNTCGLHVHISRDGLGETSDEQARVINNIILIIENFKQNIIKLTRRNDDQLKHWAQFISDYNGDDLRDVEKIKKCDKSGRYLAVNLNNYKTIELRIFRGTLNVDTFYATLHLVNNIVEIAKRENVRGISFKQLIHLNNYADLIEYAKQRGCNNNVIIIDRGNKTKRLENKTRRDQLKRVVKTNVLKTNIFTDLLQYASVIDDAIYYIDKTNARREIENILNIQRDVKKELIYKDYNELLNIFRYHYETYYGAKMYEYLNADNMKRARELYNEITNVIKAVI